MIKTITNRISIKFFIILITVIGIMFSCRKDISKQQQVVSPIINEAQLWYQSSYPASNDKNDFKSMASGDGTEKDLSKILNPKWENGTEYNINNEDVVELPSVNKRGMVLTNHHLTTGTYNFGHPCSISKIVIIRNSDKQFRCYVLTIASTGSTPTQDSLSLAKNTFNHKEANFTGLMLFHTMQGNFVSGYQYVNGKLTGILAKAQPPQVQNTSGLKTNIAQPEPCAYAFLEWNISTCTDWYQGGAYIDTTCTYTSQDAGYIMVCPTVAEALSTCLVAEGMVSRTLHQIHQKLKN